jgi:hypothetical protein
MVSFPVTHLDLRVGPHVIDVESAFRKPFRFGDERSIHRLVVNEGSGLMGKSVIELKAGA